MPGASYVGHLARRAINRRELPPGRPPDATCCLLALLILHPPRLADPCRGRQPLADQLLDLRKREDNPLPRLHDQPITQRLVAGERRLAAVDHQRCGSPIDHAPRHDVVKPPACARWRWSAAYSAM